MRPIRLLGVALCAFVMGAGAQSPTPVRLTLPSGIALTYIEQGRGETMILLHGGQGDYRSWAPQLDVLSRHFRVISYSRRYNFPNRNEPAVANHSAAIEAADLAALIVALHLKRVHLIGTSLGAATALEYAVHHPTAVRSLVLAEPALHSWIRDSVATADVFTQFMSVIQEPAAIAFRSGNDTAGMRAFVDGFAGTARFDRLDPAIRASIMQNAGAMKAMALSTDPYPAVPTAPISRLRIPVLIITGANTIAIHRLVDDELIQLLPRARAVTIPDAGHGSPRENPTAFNVALMTFLLDLKR
jgi:pimeloyl-ACP methyl ester carboxylesterase